MYGGRGRPYTSRGDIHVFVICFFSCRRGDCHIGQIYVFVLVRGAIISLMVDLGCVESWGMLFIGDMDVIKEFGCLLQFIYHVLVDGSMFQAFQKTVQDLQYLVVLEDRRSYLAHDFKSLGNGFMEGLH